MKTKEEYYEHIKAIRVILSDPENTKCNCPKTKCEWHGNCTQCVASHRYFGDHVPNCFQAVFNSRIKEMVQIFELVATEKEKTPDSYREYVKEMDRKGNQS